MKFDYSRYEQFIDSLDLKSDPFNPDFEEMKEYIDISDNFDPINNPPEDVHKKDYILQTIVPIMKHHTKEMRGILTVETEEDNIVISLFTKWLIILDDDIDLKNIFFFASSFIVSVFDQTNLKLQLIFKI